MWHQRSQHSPKPARFTVPLVSGDISHGHKSFGQRLSRSPSGEDLGTTPQPPSSRSIPCEEGNEAGGRGGSRSSWMESGCRSCGFSPLAPPGTERAKAAAVHPGPCGNGTGAADMKRHFATQPASPTGAGFSYQPRAALRATLRCGTTCFFPPGKLPGCSVPKSPGLARLFAGELGELCFPHCAVAHLPQQRGNGFCFIEPFLLNSEKPVSHPEQEPASTKQT